MNALHRRVSSQAFNLMQAPRPLTLALVTAAGIAAPGAFLGRWLQPAAQVVDSHCCFSEEQEEAARSLWWNLDRIEKLIKEFANDTKKCDCDCECPAGDLDEPEFPYTSTGLHLAGRALAHTIGLILRWAYGACRCSRARESAGHAGPRSRGGGVLR